MKLLSLLFIAFVCCFASPASAQDGLLSSTEHYKGNTISNTYMLDTIIAINAETGEMEAKIMRVKTSTRINNEQIYYEDQASEPIGGASQSSLEKYLRSLLTEEIDILRKAKVYTEITIIIDKNGALAYYDTFASTRKKMSARKFAVIRKRMEQKLDAVKFHPAMKDGTAVNYGTDLSWQ